MRQSTFTTSVLVLERVFVFAIVRMPGEAVSAAAVFSSFRSVVFPRQSATLIKIKTTLRITEHARNARVFIAITIGYGLSLATDKDNRSKAVQVGLLVL